MTQPSPILRAKTPSFAHHALSFSPFFEDRIALASGANFGLVGNGRVHILQLSPGGLQIAKWFDTKDCVYDVAWNESHENQLVAGCGNGSLKLFDITLQGLPIKAWHEHSAEIMSVDWSNLSKDTFVTSSWDQSVKIWTQDRSTSLTTIHAHTSQIYKASFSPHNPNLLSTIAADGHLKLWDLRQARSQNQDTPSTPAKDIIASPTEVLGMDWNKYDGHILGTTGKDQLVRIWDLRVGSGGAGGSGYVMGMKGHGLAVRKLEWSPHSRDILATSSYDMTCRTWDTRKSQPLHVHDMHNEFVMGLGWALFDEGLLGTAAWDEEVHLFRPEI